MKEIVEKTAERYGFEYKRLVGKYKFKAWPRREYPMGLVRGTLYAYLRYEKGLHPTEIAKFFGRDRTTVITVGANYQFLAGVDSDVRDVYESIKRIDHGQSSN